MIQKQTDSATVRGPPGPTIVIYKELIRVQQQHTVSVMSVSVKKLAKQAFGAFGGPESL